MPSGTPSARAGDDAVALEVDREHPARADHQPVDPAGDPQVVAARHRRADVDLGEAGGIEDLRRAPARPAPAPPRRAARRGSDVRAAAGRRAPPARPAGRPCRCSSSRCTGGAVRERVRRPLAERLARRAPARRRAARARASSGRPPAAAGARAARPAAAPRPPGRAPARPRRRSSGASSTRASPSGPGSALVPRSAIAVATRSCQLSPLPLPFAGWPAPADDQPLPRAGQGDVEQPAALEADRPPAALPRRAASACGQSSRRTRHAGSPSSRRSTGGRIPAVLGDGGVGQDDDRRLQPLGAMHGHHPHLVDALLAAALDRHHVAVEPGEEARERRRLDALVGERLVEQRVDAVLGLGAEARDEPAPPVVPHQHPRDQLERPQEVGLGAQLVERGPAPPGTARAGRRAAPGGASPCGRAPARRARARTGRRAGCAGRRRARGRRPAWRRSAAPP